MNKLQLMAVIIFGCVILPLVTTMASGSWYYPSDDPSDCRKCHEKIYDEFQNNIGAHQNFTCGGCHMNSDVDYSLPPLFNLTWLKLEPDEPHAAICTKCVDCHIEPANRLGNESEVHCRFYLESLNLSVSPSSTCIACHTHAQVNLTWEKFKYLNITVNKNNISVN